MTLWLWNAVKRSIYLATGLPTEPLTTTTTPALHHWIELLRAPADADRLLGIDPRPAAVVAHSWSNTSSSAFAGASASAMRCRPGLSGCWTSTRYPMSIFACIPIRFMDDLMFAVRASQPDTQATVCRWPCPKVRSSSPPACGKRCASSSPKLGCPTTRCWSPASASSTSTQIVDGVSSTPNRTAPEIHAICARYAAVVLKPHPLDRHHSLLTIAAVAPGPILGVIDDNIYRMIALPQITAVLTVNSGVAHEAPYFGKRVHTLAPLSLAWPGATPKPDPGAHASLDDVVLTPDFWRIVL